MLMLVRGIPGSGKTTVAETIAALNPTKRTMVLSADMYFEDEDGNYNFDPAKLGAAHTWCQLQAHKALILGLDVIVANTFTTEKEMKPYFDMAKEEGEMVFSVIVENRHGNNNVHNVPAETIQRMRDRFTVKL